VKDPSGRLLVVDDNEINLDLLSRRLARAGHSVRTASSGEAALALLRQEPFDLVLLDVMMPGIDGFEVLRRVRAEHHATSLPVIMATARDQREDVVQALSLGANDYVTKPLDLPVVLARVGTQLSLKAAVDRIIELERDLERRNAELQAANDRMHKDLRAAARVQQSLLPAAAPDVAGVRFGWEYRPCDELAGDILNVFRLDADHVGMYVLDVSGHGVPAALLSVTLSRLLVPVDGRASLVRRPMDGGGTEITPPAEVARELNRRFQLDAGAEQYFTLGYGVLDVRRQELRWVSAGHPGPIHVSARGEAADLTCAGFPIGWVEEVAFPEQRLSLSRGDRLYWCSDGIQEARNERRAMFGAPRVIETVRGAREADLTQSLTQLVRAALEWTGSRFDDDVSVLALEVE
jgi:sigma-B regulation protein RsbU (phosphoserine phosphatase)